MTEASKYLCALAQRNIRAYIAHTNPRAILLTGSAAVGESDFFSDLDLIIYYDALPSDDALAAARRQNGGRDLRSLGPRTERSYGEQYFVDGVPCQVAHITVAAWEEDMAKLLLEYDTSPPLQKAMSGLLDGMPLHGEEILRKWQARAAKYPDGLARAMVEHHLQFFPIWYLRERLQTRDATLWILENLVQSSYNVLGVLAGLNRLYYSTFQFKRMRSFVAAMDIVPDNLADRLEALFRTDPIEAIGAMESIVRDGIGLVEAQMPAVATSRIEPAPGARQQPWTIRSWEGEPA